MNEPRPENGETEIESDTALVSLVSKAELNQSIATAHQWPRSITKFRRDALEMATMDERIAGECIYALPRREWDQDKQEYVKKIITGPSARLAEIIVHCWTNVRAGTRVVDEGREFITAQGVFHDLEKNVGITCEVKRRITNREGKRFSADMITVTANAGCSIALRNAIFKGIPKALWLPVESEVRKVIAGDAKTLGARRETVMAKLNKMGITNEQIFAVLNVAGLADVGFDEIIELNGLGNAVREGEMSIEEAFAPANKEVTVATHTQGAKEALRARRQTTGPEKQPDATAAAKQALAGAGTPPVDPKVQQDKEAQVKAMGSFPPLDPKLATQPNIPWEKEPAAKKEPEPEPKTDPKPDPKTNQEWAEALKLACKQGGRPALDEVWDRCIEAHGDRELHVDLEALVQLLYKRTAP